jgi:hypothetical protein
MDILKFKGMKRAITNFDIPRMINGEQQLLPLKNKI